MVKNILGNVSFLLSLELKDPAGMYKHRKTVLLNAPPFLTLESCLPLDAQATRCGSNRHSQKQLRGPQFSFCATITVSPDTAVFATV